MTETVQQLRDEIAVLKGEKGKPKFKPSGMEKEAGADSKGDGDDDSPSGGTPPKRRPGSNKRSKMKHLAIHEQHRVAPLQPPPLDPGSIGIAILSSRI